MTKQEIFNKVAKHLLAQQTRSAKVECLPGFYHGHEICRYKSDDGKQCAIGCLIPDSIYKPEMEERPVDVLFAQFPIVKRHINRHNIGGKFFLDLQGVHDNYEPVDWALALREFAKSNHIKVPRFLQRAP